MSFYVMDPFDKDLRSKLEKKLGVKGYVYGDEFDMCSVRSIVADPKIVNYLDGEKEVIEGYIRDYKNFLISPTGSLIFVPVVFYSDLSEKKITEMGFEKDLHYKRYFDKKEDSVDDIADFMRPYLNLSEGGLRKDNFKN